MIRTLAALALAGLLAQGAEAQAQSPTRPGGALGAPRRAPGAPQGAPGAGVATPTTPEPWSWSASLFAP
ncbi:MAG: cytochrome b/b6 domain-containing protein, partial [Myxococcota bacterium]